jgi:hypothetical protein
VKCDELLHVLFSCPNGSHGRSLSPA